MEKVTVTPGVSLPFTSSTASVARSPETIRRGRSKMRAAVGEGGAGGVCCTAQGGAKTPTIMQAAKDNWRRAGMRGIVVEKRVAMKGLCN
ncbi:MAG: hypothetical protein DMG36_01030 [Acidobacteria bacterium]|nr:MAG: hypothetical protein DMG36_01030 [Acidobacteriota bacterium]